VFLRRVTITGFKSFANKTVIDLEHGITGVVGPNGSGKSNIADAIRWAMGEQGKARLRLGDRDEVVFAGTDKRAKASFAEVILLFDNEDGSFPLDLTEVEISRRMYRSGETDYRLAGRSARLSDIQALLAGAGVGASSYAVIGQGMIDSILMSSPSERKLLFEEAAGIRGPELGREAAVRKLTATAGNLTRLRDISAELAPRLGALERAVAAADEQTRLTSRVTELRTAVASAQHAHWTLVEAGEAHRSAELLQSAHRLRHELRALERTREQQDRAEAQALGQRQQLQSGLAALELRRDSAAADLAASQSATSAAARNIQSAGELKIRLARAEADLAAAEGRLKDSRAELAASAVGAARADKAVDKAAHEVAAAQSALVAVRNGINDGSRDQYLDHALQILKTLALGLGTPQYDEGRVRLLVHKAGRLLSHATRSGAAELLAELKTAQKHLEAAMSRRETAVEHQTNVSITGRSLEIDITHLEGEVVRLTQRRNDILTELKPLELASSQLKSLQSAEHTAVKTLQDITKQLEVQRSQLADLSVGSGDISVHSKTLTALELTRAAISNVARDHTQAGQNRLAAASELAATVRRAAEWAVTITSSDAHEDLAVLTDQLARAETLLEARTQVYQEQLVEYEEVSTRQTELAAQISDLESAESDLRALVTELDTLIRSRFKENFQALAEQFKIYFGRLFNGGTASLELAETDDGTYGITIKASPNGKRLTTIAALSGGERALAGVALVAAIMRVNPSPFVVLDEIDAALDEANSGRLAGILTELQQYSQLIVITHNRQTMKAARVLFGVTINEHHISHLISMRLEQATQLAAR